MQETMTATPRDWPWLGSRWWKFDFHAHPPASAGTWWAKNDGLSEAAWLLRYMAAGIDRVAMIDHNSGAWDDRLEGTYGKLKRQVEAGAAPEGFRELTLFPGVEISVQGGFHLLVMEGDREAFAHPWKCLGRES